MHAQPGTAIGRSWGIALVGRGESVRLGYLDAKNSKGNRR